MVKLNSMKKINNIFEDYFNEWIYLYPFEASFLGFNVLDKIEEIPVNISEEFREKEKEFYNKYKNLIEDIKLNELKEEQKIHLKALKITCDISLKELLFPDNLLPINHFYSFHLIFPGISSGLNQSFKNKKEILNFHKKINYFKDWAEVTISNLKKGIASKVLLPSIIVEKILKQLEYFLLTKREINPIFKPIYLIEKEYKGKDKEKVTEKIKKEIENKVLFSYEKIYKFLKDEYLKNCNEKIGLYNLPNGYEWYKAKILRFTTLKIEPEEIYNYALKELKELKEKNRDLQKENKKIKNHIEFLKKFKKELKEKLKEYFYEFPKKDFKILPMEKYKEKTSSLAEYFIGSIDKKSKPIFYLNLNLAKKKNLNELLAIFFHEAIPGHHFQISLQREKEDLPSFLRYHIFDAFVEGWAFYSENLAYKIGIIKDENYKRVIIKNKIWRTLRLILDTGIHTGKFNKEKGVEILMEEGNFKKEEAEIEILRYAVYPGQALTYKIGEQVFFDLKERAEKELKDKFDLKEFHKILLKDGSLPLNLLKEKVNNWIKKK